MNELERKLPSVPRPQGPEALLRHADELMKMPTGEQYINHFQVVVAVALQDIARWMKEQE